MMDISDGLEITTFRELFQQKDFTTNGTKESQPLSLFLYYVLELVVFYSYFLSENYFRTIWAAVVENFMGKSEKFFISVTLALAFRLSKRKK